LNGLKVWEFQAHGNVVTMALKAGTEKTELDAEQKEVAANVG
jgi:hypothetical protein